MSSSDDRTGPPPAHDAGATPQPDDRPGRVPQHHLDALDAAREQLDRLEEALRGGSPGRLAHSAAEGVAGTRRTAHGHVPAWLRPTQGESRWPVAAAIAVAIALQVALPDQLAVQWRWPMPALELVLLVALTVANPNRFNRESRMLRAGSLVLTGMLSLANAWSATLLVVALVHGEGGHDATALLTTGAAIWVTNIIAFALWYWQFDRGGPAARANARRPLPDFQFVQMQSPELADRDWEPEFVDYLYLSFTNATAFSPTDVMPLSRWAKLTMLTQAAISLITVALVIARAVNVLR